ncbi:MAG: S8 family serine peptidase [Sandaracinus sp.]
MTSRARRVGLGLALLTSLATPVADAQRIDPSISRPRTLPERPIGGRTYAFPRRGTPVLVELRPDADRLSPEPMLELDALPDVELVRTYDRFALVRVGLVGVSSLAGSRLVLRAMDARTSPPLLPLERTRSLLELEAGWGRATVDRTPSDRFTGAGVTIGDIDTPLDVFHPTFFRGDAGWYDWIDVDGDGALTPGVDAIDLDGDGAAGEAELAHALRAAPVDLRDGRTTDAPRTRGFDPGFDWIYLDENGDGFRNTARTMPDVTDETPAFGEPLFTPDDVDRDGVLEVNERLVRLGSSKVAHQWIDLVGPTSPQHLELERGVDLHTARRDYTGGIFGYADTLHGSGVMGILVGDLPLVGRRWVGIAPDAELVNAFYWGDTQSEPLLWALSYADVIVHEYVGWTRVAMDGGDPLAMLIDESTGNGLVHVCPAGNIGGARKHTHVDATGGTAVTLPIEVPADVPYWDFSLHAAGRAVDELTLTVPSGETFSLGAGSAANLPVGLAYSRIVTTLRDREIFTVAVATEDGSPVASGGYSITFTTTEDASVDAFVSDSASGFALGVAFPTAIATDRGTISWPATSDACIAVGAVPAYLDREGGWIYGGPEDAGQVRAYSSRGPRIDGDARVHVVAPDNPWSALGAGDIYPQYPGTYIAPEGAFQIFGGTSGAGPHAAGVAALLVQSGLRGADVRARLMSTSIDDGFATLPSPDYGMGRIDALRALANGDADDGGEPPTVTLAAVPSRIDLGQSVQLVASASDPEGTAVEARFDDGYDGAWDTEYASVLEHTFTPTLTSGTEGWVYAKVRVRDAAGLVAEASVRIRVGAFPAGVDGGEPDAGIGPDAGPGSGGGGCGCRVGTRPTRTANGSGETEILGIALGMGVFARSRRRRSTR